MKKKELFEQYETVKGQELSAIVLYIQMPTGEIEIIQNPNVIQKLRYIDQTYDEELVHCNCDAIRITKVEFLTKTGLSFGAALEEGKKRKRISSTTMERRCCNTGAISR